jgi:dTDP-3-amino-3,4,6-trideoxy-alpha-D-glucose transaminase
MTAAAVRWADLKPREESAAVDAAIRRVLDRGWFVLGPEVEAFEVEFAAATAGGQTITVASGTDALTLILRALGIGPGDEVITTALSAVYTAQAVMMAGARPVFADLDPERLTLDPAAVAGLIGPSTAAVMPVHLYGQPADLAALRVLTERHGLALIEDCCQAHLATCDGVPIGTTGVAAAYSFYPTKNLGAFGDGGAVCTADSRLAARIRQLRNGGQTARDHHVEPAAHSRLDELQAAVLRARLPYLPAWTARRRRLAAHYREGLTATAVRVPPELDAGHVYHLFPIRTAARDRLREHLGARDIDTLIHYPVPLPAQPAFAAAAPQPCPIAATVCDELVSLPLYPGLDDEAVTRVVDAIASAPGD